MSVCSLLSYFMSLCEIICTHSLSTQVVRTCFLKIALKMRGLYGRGFVLRKTSLKPEGEGDASCLAACFLVCLHLFLIFLFSSSANEEIRPHAPAALVHECWCADPSAVPVVNVVCHPA